MRVVTLSPILSFIFKKDMIFTIPYDDLKDYKVSGKQMKDIGEINISFILSENGNF